MSDGVWVWYVGFSCTSVSGLHCNGRGSSHVDDRSGATGITFSAVLCLLQSHSPDHFICENVFGLLVGDQHLAVVQALQECGRAQFGGYFVFMYATTPLEYGWPTSRRRLYFVGVRRSLLPLESSGVCSEEMYTSLDDFCSGVLTAFRTGFADVDPDTLLLSENSPLVRQSFRDHQTKLQNSQQPRKLNERLVQGGKRGVYRKGCPRQEGKWVGKHKVMAETRHHIVKARSNWIPEVHDNMFPHWRNLPLRDKDLLDFAGISFPDNRKLLINTSQTEYTAGSPIITPGGQYWIAWRSRMLLGCEALAFQCLYLEPVAFHDFDWKEQGLLQDLAGNAFHGLCVLESTLLLLCLRAHIDASATVVSSSIANSKDATADSCFFRVSANCLAVTRSRASSPNPPPRMPFPGRASDQLCFQASDLFLLPPPPTKTPPLPHLEFASAQRWTW